MSIAASDGVTIASVDRSAGRPKGCKGRFQPLERVELGVAVFDELPNRRIGQLGPSGDRPNGDPSGSDAGAKVIRYDGDAGHAGEHTRDFSRGSSARLIGRAFRRATCHNSHMTLFSERIKELAKAAGEAIGRPGEGRRHLARRMGISDDTVGNWMLPDNHGTGSKVVRAADRIGLKEPEIRGWAPLPEGWLEHFSTKAWDEERATGAQEQFVASLTDEQKAQLRRLLKAG